MDEYYEEMVNDLKNRYNEYTSIATNPIERYALAYSFWFKEKMAHETEVKDQKTILKPELQKVSTKADWLKWIFISNALNETEDIITNKFNEDTIKEIEFRTNKFINQK